MEKWDLYNRYRELTGEDYVRQNVCKIPKDRFHLVVHVFQAVAVRGYVPGVVSALVFIPYVGYGVYSIWLVLSVPQMVAWAAIGIAFMVINLWLAHRLGMIIASKK